ncbi:MAG: hypothetical protein HWD59_10005 [Coxiellaceae bacterium]|nr:MAG: hypothetical protein HWD59_10005 [Coxiellaceae bacterium]
MSVFIIKSQESVFAVVPEARLKQLNRELFPSARPSQTTVEESRVEEIKDEPIEEVVKKSASKPSYIVTSPVHCSQQAKEPEYIIQSPGICSP